MEIKGFNFEKPQEIHYEGGSNEAKKKEDNNTPVFERPKDTDMPSKSELEAQISSVPEVVIEKVSPAFEASGEINGEVLRAMKIAETKGVDEAIKEISKDAPEIIDEFHDKLIKEIKE